MSVFVLPLWADLCVRIFVSWRVNPCQYIPISARSNRDNANYAIIAGVYGFCGMTIQHQLSVVIASEPTSLRGYARKVLCIFVVVFDNQRLSMLCWGWRDRRMACVHWQSPWFERIKFIRRLDIDGICHWGYYGVIHNSPRATFEQSFFFYLHFVIFDLAFSHNLYHV